MKLMLIAAVLLSGCATITDMLDRGERSCEIGTGRTMTTVWYKDSRAGLTMAAKEPLAACAVLGQRASAQAVVERSSCSVVDGSTLITAWDTGRDGGVSYRAVPALARSECRQFQPK